MTKSFQPKSLRQRALEYLGKREYSYAELSQKLKSQILKNGAEETDGSSASEQISVILDDFKTRGWLSDKRFTEQMVHARQVKFGVNKIAHELRQKGVSQDLIADAIEKVKECELDSAKEIWQKRFKTTPANRDEWTKHARFLQSRGFGFDVIKKVLNSKLEDDN